jgi:hypothetical protein
MDYVALVKSPLWQELWEDEIVTEKVNEIRNQLLGTAQADPHTLGKLRGQLEALQGLRTRVEAKAKQQMEIAAGVVAMPAESVSQSAWWLRKRRII